MNYVVPCWPELAVRTCSLHTEGEPCLPGVLLPSMSVHLCPGVMWRLAGEAVGGAGAP